MIFIFDFDLRQLKVHACWKFSFVLHVNFKQTKALHLRTFSDISDEFSFNAHDTWCWKIFYENCRHTTPSHPAVLWSCLIFHMKKFLRISRIYIKDWPLYPSSSSLLLLLFFLLIVWLLLMMKSMKMKMNSKWGLSFLCA